jgi:hypothetical protein
VAWQEDDVVHALAQRWRGQSIVLAAGGNQGALHFLTKDRRRKAPDLVAYVDSTILVFETKVRTSALFAGGTNSDAARLTSLLEDPEHRQVFIHKVLGLLGSMQLETTPDPGLVVGLLAGSSFSTDQVRQAADLVCIEATQAGRVAAVAGAELLPDACAAALD